MSLLHRTMKRRDAPFASLKDSVMFAADVLECTTLKRYLEKSGVSATRIVEFTKALYQLAILGIYVEMTEGFTEDESIVFGLATDFGSKVKKTKNYAGFAVKYPNLKEKAIACRVIGKITCIFPSLQM